MKDPNCIFCKIANKEVPSEIIWENEKFISFMDITPVKTGHIMVIPKKHVDYIFDLDEETYTELFSVAKNLSIPLKNATGSKRIGIVAEGFGVPHCHLHLIPIDKGGEIDSINARKADQQELKDAAEKIRKFI